MPLVHDFRLHEKIAEGRSLRIARRRRKHYFGIGRDLDRSPRTRAIGDSHPAQLDVVLRRHRYFGVRIEIVVAPTKFDTTFGKYNLVALRRFQCGLISGRPVLTARHVAQIAKAAPVVAGAVLAPPCYRQVPPPAAAPASVSHHDVVTAVRKKLHFRNRGVGRGEDTHRHLGRIVGGANLRKFPYMRAQCRCSRNPLLEQQHRRLEQGVRPEAPLHWLIQEQISQRKQTHSLVMRHERANDRARFASPQP